MLSDPPSESSEYLSKKVASIMQLDLEKDESLRCTLKNLNLDENFVNKNFVAKSKQYDFLPISYNSHILANHIRYNQQ